MKIDAQRYDVAYRFWLGSTVEYKSSVSGSWKTVRKSDFHHSNILGFCLDLLNPQVYSEVRIVEPMHDPDSWRYSEGVTSDERVTQGNMFELLGCGDTCQRQLGDKKRVAELRARLSAEPAIGELYAKIRARIAELLPERVKKI